MSERNAGIPMPPEVQAIRDCGFARWVSEVSPSEPKKTLLGTAIVGIGGPAPFPLAFWRPPKPTDAGS